MWFIISLFASILWGLNYSLTEKILKDISPITLLALEMLVGAVFFFTLSFFFQLKNNIATLINDPYLLTLVIIEVIAVVLANFLIVFSINSKNATIVGIIELIYPLFTILFTALIFHENHVNSAVIIGGSFIMVGVSIIYFL